MENLSAKFLDIDFFPNVNLQNFWSQIGYPDTRWSKKLGSGLDKDFKPLCIWNAA